jgi:hypothetical protein
MRVSLPTAKEPTVVTVFPFGRSVELRGCDGVVEVRGGTVREQSAVADPLNELTQFWRIGLDDEVHGQSIGWYRHNWTDDRHQRSARP